MPTTEELHNSTTQLYSLQLRTDIVYYVFEHKIFTEYVAVLWKINSSLLSLYRQKKF